MASLTCMAFGGKFLRKLAFPTSSLQNQGAGVATRLGRDEAESHTTKIRDSHFETIHTFHGHIARRAL
ncbi:hypothetical protein T03_4701 [Trichinella britovi]|uniref:Uncharacterized protein n=1 Tax=Trichinella britovi TaxID=45882 RepID=A0A0V1CA34_TRIBR|nr:hypothetical protein T03_4701 [Trichinella britovi]